VAQNTGDKASALDVVGRTGEGEVIRLPDAAQPIGAAIERYALLFLTVERLQVEGREPTSGTMRELGTAAATLDTVQPGGAEDLRIMLDRASGPAPTPGADGMRELRQAWAEEGKLRTDPAAFAVQFVADWRAASGALSMVQTAGEEAQAERRIERLENRMLEQPALERALDRAIPERQLTISEPGSTGPARERDFDMDM
jgi:hypothetical protein